VQESLEPYVDPNFDGASPPSSTFESVDRRNFALDLLAHWPDGRIKQYLLSRMLRWRRAHADLFREGVYRPLMVEHASPSGWVAFAREPGAGGGPSLICCVRVRGLGKGGNAVTGGYPTWTEASEPETLRLPGDWAHRTWRNLFTGSEFHALPDGDTARMDLGALGADFPVAWLWG
jgi:(1->4)-alpha-D-glucan 1-alpha-D-glucosylmutase